MIGAVALAVAAAAAPSPLAAARFDGLTKSQQVWIKGLAAHAPREGRQGRVISVEAPAAEAEQTAG